MNNNDKNEKDLQTQIEKTEIAKFIADKSLKISSLTDEILSQGLRVLRWMSDRFDEILFNPKHGKLVAFLIALMITIGFSTNSVTTPLQQSREISVPVFVNYNSEMYEISEIPDTIKVQLIGSANDLTMLQTDSSSIRAVLNLTGLTEGKHSVKYSMEGISNRIKTIIQPESQTVDIQIKNAAIATIGYDFINQHKLGQQFVLSEPTFEINEVSIKASQSTLDKVAFVKALIDVAGRTDSFETESILVAYDQNGNRLEQVDIIPKSVKASVTISSPSKTVLIKPVFEGSMPDGKTIADYKLDQESITIYAPLTVLDTIDEIRVSIPTSKLTEDTTKFTQNIILPTGVRYGTVSKVNVEVNLGTTSSTVFENIPIIYRNNVNGLKASLVNKDDAVIDVTVFGTESNLADGVFNKDNIVVYVDLRNAKEGENQTFELFISYVDPKAPLYVIQPSKTSIQLDIMR